MRNAIERLRNSPDAEEGITAELLSDFRMRRRYRPSPPDLDF